MIVGFLGKGGSGKSSVSSQAVFHLLEKGHDVMAIDADHNMDLFHNINNGKTLDGMNYIGQSLDEIQQYVGLSVDDKYDQAFLRGCDKRFSTNPLDLITEKYSYQMKDNLRAMVAGPQIDKILYGQTCAHILTTPLKIYLPLLETQENQVVVIDEKAGADGVTTGIVTGIDVGVIVCEPSVHSIKTGLQIAELMRFFDTPYMFVGNKVFTEEDKQFLEDSLSEELTAVFGQSSEIRRNPYDRVTEWQDAFEKVMEKAAALNKNDRLERTKIKFNRNKEFQKSEG